MGSNISICLAWHNLDSTNFGVAALALSQIGLIVRAAEDAGVTVTIDTMGTHADESLGIRRYAEQQYGLQINHTEYSLRLLLKGLLRFDFSLVKLFQKYDVIMDIGEGDSFTDIYGIKRFLLLALTKFIPIVSSKPLILSPQTFGPFNSRFSRIAAGWIMRRCNGVFSRDYKSTKFIRQMGIACDEVSDVAFTLEFSPQTKTPKAVGLNISGLLWNGGYSGHNQFGITIDYKRFVTSVVDGFLTRGCEVHLIGHVIADELPVEDDYRVCNAIKQQYSAIPAVIVGPKFSSPVAAKSYMSQLEFFTGSRMHATIGALSAGVATVPIAYSRKFSGVFGALGYDYTLDAYSLTTDQMVQKLFAYYDNSFAVMEKAVEAAKSEAVQRNQRYLAHLVRVFKNA